MAEAPESGFDIRRMLLLGGVSVVLIISVFFLFIRGCGTTGRRSNDYIRIYSNLELKDAANVVARLKELKIPYEIKDNGQAIAVRKDKSDQARLGLAEKNLPMGGAVGWEIFDEAKLGATDFDRRIQLIRAISGELSRTIRQIQAVMDVRVQIVIPETRLFAATVAPVTAAVLLRLKPGAELSRGKINGIVHLVASSVENLQPENVTVVDNTGRILTAKGSSIGKATLMPFEKASKPLSTNLKTITIASQETTSPETVAKTIVKPLTAEEKSLLKVRAKKELEENLAGKAQEILNRFYPPNSVIVKINLELKKAPSVAEFKLDDLAIIKMTAIVLVDNRVDTNKEFKDSTYQAVAAAIGYNRKRGDKILLQKVPFHLATPPPEVIQGEVKKILPPLEKKKKFWSVKTFGLIGVGLIIILIFLIRRKRKNNSKELETVETPLQTEAPIEKSQPPSLLNNIKNIAETNPEQIAELLRGWLSQ